MTDVSRETAALIDRYSGIPGMLQFAELLATAGVERGLLGPREVERLWPRHLANCAVVAEEARAQIPEGSTVADVGAGAGLPGVVWALVRRDISMTLIEPLLRRATFLTEVVEELDLRERVTVVRSRAEDVDAQFDVVTARAVARLPQLAAWTLPLTRLGGWTVALKGAGARDEVASAAEVIVRLGGGPAQIVEYGGGVLAAPTTAVLIQRARMAEQRA